MRPSESQLDALIAYDPRHETDFDPGRELAAVRRRPHLEGTRPVTLTPLEAVAARLAAEPSSVLVVSDVHGAHGRLRGCLTALGCLDEDGRRRVGRGFLVQVGDLIDGRHLRDDLTTLELGRVVFDRCLLGNHELALLGGPRFDGMPTHSPLGAALREAGLPHAAAHAVGDVLISHAGVRAEARIKGDATRVAEVLNERTARVIARPRRRGGPVSVSGVSWRRGGSRLWGGVCWEEWAGLLAAPAPGVRQIVGHSSRPVIEESVDGRLVCLDTAGARLGVALLTPDGAALYACYEEPAQAA